MKLYLAHPLTSRKSVKEWELKMEKEYDIDLQNPFYDKGGTGGRDDIKLIDMDLKPEVNTDLDWASTLVMNDLKQILDCDGTLAVIDGAVSYGTIMEIVYTYFTNKPVYIIVTNGKEWHPWLTTHSKKIFTSFDEAEQWIKEETNNEKLNTKKS